MMRMPELQPGDVDNVTIAIRYLKLARDRLKAVGAPKALAKVRKALRSAEGALRHVGRRKPYETLWGPER